MKWLHISDIHFNFKGYKTYSVRDKLKEFLKKQNLKLDFILVTGDCTYQNNDDGKINLEDVANYIKEIAFICGCEQKNIYVCQGNHDIDRKCDSRNEKIVKIRDIKKNKELFLNAYSSLCNLGNDKFRIIYNYITSRNYKDYEVFCSDERNYRIISLNSCLLSKDKKDYQKLKVYNDKLNDIRNEIKDDDKLNILIMHHGIDWFETENARDFEYWVEENNIDVVYCGHTHRAAIETYNNIGRHIEQFTAGALVDEGYAIPSFYICEYDESKNEIMTSLYTFSLSLKDWVIDNHHLRKFKNGNYRYKLDRLSRNEEELDNKIGYDTKISKEHILKYDEILKYLDDLSTEQNEYIRMQLVAQALNQNSKNVNFSIQDIQKSALIKFEKSIMESMLKGIICKKLERKIEVKPIPEENHTVYKVHITEYHQLQLLSDEANTAIRNHRFRFISQKQNDSFNLKAMIVNGHNYQNELANYVQKQSAMNNTDSNSVGNRTFNYVINVSLPQQPKNLREIEYKIDYEYENYEMGTYLTSALNYPTHNINEVYSIIGEHAQKYIIHGFSHFPYHSQPGKKIHFKRINFSSLQILISNDWQLPGSGSSVVVRKRNEQSEVLN